MYNNMNCLQLSALFHPQGLKFLSLRPTHLRIDFSLFSHTLFYLPLSLRAPIRVARGRKASESASDCDSEITRHLNQSQDSASTVTPFTCQQNDVSFPLKQAPDSVRTSKISLSPGFRNICPPIIPRTFPLRFPTGFVHKLPSGFRRVFSESFQDSCRDLCWDEHFHQKSKRNSYRYPTRPGSLSNHDDDAEDNVD